MKTIKQIAEELGVSKQSVEKKIKKEPLATQLINFIDTKGYKVYVNENGEKLIKSTYQKTANQTTNQTANQPANQTANQNNLSIDNLKKLPVWVNWKLEERDGKKTKVPYNPKTGGKAQSNNSDTWADFNFAQSKSADYNGIGFMFADGICGIDIDNKTSKPELDRQAEAIIKLMDTYTEKSPSGTGWHLIFKCDISKIPTINGKLDDKYYFKNPHNDLECYFPGLTNRYFTYTGEAINDKNIEDRTEQILIFIENYMLKENFKKKKNPEWEQSERISAADISDIDIIDKIRQSKQGYKFSALFDRGDTSAYNNDNSAADEALCCILAWWLQGDFNEIDYYFRQSRLYRDKWERADYRTNTINKAIDSCGGGFYTPKNPVGRPKKESRFKSKVIDETPEVTTQDIIDMYGELGDGQVTIAGIALYLHAKGISVKYNEITRKDEFHGNINKYKAEHIKNDIPAAVYNDLKLMLQKCPKGDVFDFIKVISNRNAYNPVLGLIEGGKWDGVDRLPDLYCIMRIKPDDNLSHRLIYKWLWQNISMARNENGKYGSDGLLVLQGKQGIGKTTFARKMALNDDWFADGLHLNFSDKDTTRRATSVWIGELGEISRTFKSDIDALKAFITTPRDIYRLPYGHADEELSRRTSFIGTCNDEHYLIDETGNRRFWTVPITEKIDLPALKQFDAFQVYMQVYEQDAKNNIQGFRLTGEEQTQLYARNGQFEKPLKSEMEIRDILSETGKDDLLKEMTASKFKDYHLSLRNYDVSQIGRALNKIGVEFRDTNKGKLYMLPTNVKTI
jgi:hypothetical protein